MRVLLVAPWNRPLARALAGALRAAGCTTLVVSTPLHHEHADARADEVELTGSPRSPRAWADGVRVLRAARSFRPDVVLAEEFTDPRLVPLLALAPVATLVHDDAPHDATERRALQHRLVFGVATRRADLLVTFSEHVAAHARGRWSAPVVTVPLPSEAPAALVPPLVGAQDRRDVVALGRINPYKDLPTTLAAWQRHVDGPGYRGDELLVVGDGTEGALTLPARCRWRRERFQFAEVVPLLARAKASVVAYRSATQSGVQVTSMQCGTTAVVTAAGGLPEYLPPGQATVPVGDVVALATALDELADPAVAAASGRRSREHHDAHLGPEAVAAALAPALHGLVRG